MNTQEKHSYCTIALISILYGFIGHAIGEEFYKYIYNRRRKAFMASLEEQGTPIEPDLSEPLPTRDEIGKRKYDLRPLT